MPRFDQSDLLPVVAQDVDTGAVLMLAYANEEAVARSLATGRAHFFSRSRQEIWDKGSTSGQVLEVMSIAEDCDGDALLYRVRAPRGTCHTGAYSCFGDEGPRAGELGRLWQTISARIESADPEESYTRRLYEAGIDRVLRKIGEEAGEVIIAGKGGRTEEITAEACDLIYHLWLALRTAGVDLADVAEELRRRAEKGVVTGVPAPDRTLG